MIDHHLIISLRQQGKSLNDIQNITGYKKTTVYYWIQNMPLSKFQKNILITNTYNKKIILAEKQKQSFREKRKVYQNKGKQLIPSLSKNDLFILGMIWGEGSKCKNTAAFSNCDIQAIKLYLSFLYRKFKVKKNQVNISINCYLGKVSIKQIKKFWLQALKLPESSWKQPTIKNKYYKIPKKLKWPYGVCQVRVHNTEITQQIFGAIKSLAQINDDRWLD